MIPKKIHYCWFGGKKLPKDVKKCIKSWKKYCPNYEIIEWNEKNFDVRSSKFMSDAYDAKAWAFVSDYARLKVIYENGGVYLDTDVELLKPLDELLKDDCYFATQQYGEPIATGLGFGAIKGHFVLKEMLDLYDSLTFRIEEKNKLMCPILNTKILNMHGYSYSNEIIILKDANIKIYPTKYFDPLTPGNTKNLLCDDTISIHHYSASWTSNKNVLKRKIIRIIGQRKVNFIKKIIKRK